MTTHNEERYGSQDIVITDDDLDAATPPYTASSPRERRSKPKEVFDNKYKPKFYNCVENHACDSAWDSDLPARLLDLENPEPDRIKLVTTEHAFTEEQRNNGVRYVALSYCWGESTPFTTTSSTLRSRLQGFLVSSMPLTLRDAVKVTKGLGIRYLWIDALCIVQGGRIDPVAAEDWSRESARMQSIYGNAFVTIVAAAAPDAASGLVRSGLSLRRRDIAGGVEAEDGGHGAFGGMHKEAISSRAWTLQEWLLSTRLLVFTSSRVYFVCDWYQILQHTYRAEGLRLLKAPSVLEKNDWVSLVVTYCGRDLTEPGDKLPALAGLARRYSDLMGWPSQDYLAGLWRGTIIRELVWRREGSSGWPFVPTAKVTGRHLERAPSWSWASVDGNVSYIGPSPGTVAEDVEVLSCNVKPAVEGDYFGKVLSGVLTLRCPYTLASIRGIKDKDEDDEWYFSEDEDDELSFGLESDNGKHGTMAFDDVSIVKSLMYARRVDNVETKVYCLLMTGILPGNCCGVVVFKDEEQDTFVRLGWFYTSTFDRDGKMTFNVV